MSQKIENDTKHGPEEVNEGEIMNDVPQEIKEGET